MDAQVFVVHQILDHSSGDTANTQLKSSSVGNHLGDELSNPLFLRSEGRHRQLGKGRVIFDDEIDVVDMQETCSVGAGHIGIDLHNHLPGLAAYFQIVVYRYPQTEAAVAVHRGNRGNSCVDLAFLNENPGGLVEQVGCISSSPRLIGLAVHTAKEV